MTVVVRPRLDLPPEVRLLAVNRHSRHGPSTFASEGNWWLHAYTYHARLQVLGARFDLAPGTVTLIPPGVTARYDFPETAIHTCAHVRLPAGDGSRAVSLSQDLAGGFATFHADFTAAVGWWAVEPARAQARVWDLLWRLVEAPEVATGDLVARARSHIEQNLGQPMAVAGLARRLGVSHNTLTRAFRAHLGETVVGYIRARRLAQARHFLQQAAMPPRQVAALVGVPDLQAFNKLVRRGCGVSPRALVRPRPRP